MIGGDLHFSSKDRYEPFSIIYTAGQLYLLTSAQLAELEVLVDDLAKRSNLIYEDIEALVLNRSFIKTQ